MKNTNNPIEKKVEINSIQFYYRDWGGSGQEIVLLHGLASNSRIWDLVAPILSENFRVIALDQRGHGLTSKPLGGYDFNTVINDLDGFLGKINFNNPIIIGHSWGAMVALSYAEKNIYKSKGLCLIDGGTTEISSHGFKYYEIKKKYTPPNFIGTNLGDFKKRIYSKIKSSDQMLLEDIILSNFDIKDNVIIGPKLTFDKHMKIIESIWNYKPTEMYENIKVPVLLIPARRDNENQFNSEKSIKLIGLDQAINSLEIVKLIWFDDSIHDIPLQKPKLLAKQIINEFKSGFFNL